ncbi:hypothetical protein F2Q70_00003487 [Brassica cretica]|uniref:Uncharacterized protein n=1 Tax=Brassica cretica TaxID=69181 RepID=A0A8S9J0X7_BRACR|nr:hypothetical protein F2Q70_00003487 [Brassica cretica]KAF3565852.1 hypothetical protein DY000_02015394 [Brassica cretica]
MNLELDGTRAGAERKLRLRRRHELSLRASDANGECLGLGFVRFVGWVLRDLSWSGTRLLSIGFAGVCFGTQADCDAECEAEDVWDAS